MMASVRRFVRIRRVAITVQFETKIFDDMIRSNLHQLFIRENVRLKIRLCHCPLIGVWHEISQDTPISFSSRHVERFGRAACGGGRSCLSFFGDNVRHFNCVGGWGKATLVNSCELMLLLYCTGFWWIYWVSLQACCFVVVWCVVCLIRGVFFERKGFCNYIPLHLSYFVLEPTLPIRRSQYLKILSRRGGVSGQYWGVWSSSRDFSSSASRLLVNLLKTMLERYNFFDSR